MMTCCTWVMLDGGISLLLASGLAYFIFAPYIGALDFDSKFVGFGLKGCWNFCSAWFT